MIATSHRPERVDTKISARSRPDREIAHQATSHLAKQIHFRCHLNCLQIDCRQGNLYVNGKLPSFYLKQVLQTTLRDLPGVGQIQNRVDVVSSTGLSSTRPAR